MCGLEADPSEKTGIKTDIMYICITYCSNTSFESRMLKNGSFPSSCQEA